MKVSFELLEYFNRPKEEREYILGEVKKYVETCERCPNLVQSRVLYPYGKPTFGYGNINSPVFFIGEAPGRYGCGTTGIPFNGDRSGDYFQKMLKEVLGFSLKEVYTTNIVKCNPENNRTPTEEERNQCMMYLATELHWVQPYVIVTLGMSATKVFMPEIEQFWKVHGRDVVLGDEIVAFGMIEGRGGWKWENLVPHNALLYPTWHPAFVMRDPPKLESRYKGEFRRIEKMIQLAYDQWRPRN